MGVLVLGYVAAQVAEYVVALSRGGALPAFGPYFDEATRAFHFDSDDAVGQPLGAWGYGVRLLEVLGFVGGGIIVPAIFRAMPYCETCGRYMKTRALGILPASVPARRTFGKGAEAKAALAEEQATARAQGQAVHDHLFALAEAGTATAFAESVGLMAAGAKDASKLPTRVTVSLSACPSCRRGVLSSQVLSGHGRGMTTTALASAPVAPDLVRALDA